MQTERCLAGVDVHKKMLAVVVGQVEERSMQVERAKFGTTTEDLELLGDWLQARGAEEVVMESTGQSYGPEIGFVGAGAKSDHSPIGHGGVKMPNLRRLKFTLKVPVGKAP